MSSISRVVSGGLTLALSPAILTIMLAVFGEFAHANPVEEVLSSSIRVHTTTFGTEIITSEDLQSKKTIIPSDLPVMCGGLPADPLYPSCADALTLCYACDQYYDANPGLVDTYGYSYAGGFGCEAARCSPIPAPGNLCGGSSAYGVLYVTYSQPVDGSNQPGTLFGTCVEDPAPLNLAVSSIQFLQPGTTQPAGSVVNLVPANAPVRANVTVSGSGFNTPETRTTTVQLQAGSQVIGSQVVNLSDIQNGGGTLTVTVPVSIDPSLVGTTQTITATVDPGNVLSESNFADNATTTQEGFAIVLNVSPHSQGECTDLLDHSTTATVAHKGCALTALNMALNSAGASYTPCSLNAKLNSVPGGFNATHDVSWVVGTSGALPGANFSYFKSSSTQTLQQDLINGYPVIVKVTSPGSGGPHYVLVYGDLNGHILIRDPGFPITTLDGAPYYSQFETRGYVNPPTQRDSSDQSLLALEASDGAEILVEDSQGRKTGFDPSTGNILQDIPGSVYFEDAMGDDITGAAPTWSTRALYIPNSSGQNYQIQLIGNTTASVVLGMTSYNSSGAMQTPENVTANVTSGSQLEFSLGSSGSLVPPPSQPSKGFIEIDQTRSQFSQGALVSGLVWTRIHPTKPNSQIKLDGALDGSPLKLTRISKDLVIYEASVIALGIHEVEIKAYLSGQEVDDAVAYFAVNPATTELGR